MNFEKTIYCLLFFSILINTHLPGQNCNCPEQFDFLTEKIEINYAGYPDKVNPETRADFEKHTAKYQALTVEATADTTCLRLLDEWTEWFKDHHIQLRNNLPAPSPENIRARFADWETIPVTEAEARLIADRAGSDPIEGIWQDESGNYKVAVLKKANEQRDYAGVVLQADSIWWMPGQVKFELKILDEPGTFNMSYYMRNHDERNTVARLENHVLHVDGLGSWVKLYPEKGVLPKSEPGQIYRLEKLDDRTLLLVVPTMNHNYRKEDEKLKKT